MRSAFNDHVLEPYLKVRNILVLAYADNPRGFYLADAKIRKERGMELTEAHEIFLLDEVKRQL